MLFRRRVEYRLSVSRLPLAWAKQYVFEAVALVGVVITQVDIWTNLDDNRTRLSAIALVTAGALVFRRRAPFVAPLVVAAGAVVFSLLDPSAAYTTDTMFLPLLLAAWAAGSLLDWRLAVTALGALLVAGWTVFIRAPDVPWTELIWLSFPLIGIFVISAAAARHSEQAREAEERVRHTEEEARRAVEDERNRIARELHDVVAHSVSVMDVQASAVRRLLEARAAARARGADDGRGDGPPGARGDAAAARDHAHRAKRSPALAPQPGLGTLAALVEQVRQAGLPVELTVEGEPVKLPGRRRPLGLPDRAGGADERAQARRPGARVGSPSATSATMSRSRWRRRAQPRGDDRRRRPRSRRHARAGRALRRRAEAGPRPGGGFEISRAAARSSRTPHDGPGADRGRPGARAAGFKMILEAEPDIEVVGEAEDGCRRSTRLARCSPTSS